MPHHPSIEELLIRQLDQPLTNAEQAMVDEWLAASPANQALYDSFRDKDLLEQKLLDYQQFDETASWNKLIASGRFTPATKSRSIVQVLQKNWYYAAAILILSVGSGIFYLNMPSGTATKDKQDQVATTREIYPANNQAVLTIGDSVINLSDDKSGIVTSGNAIAYSDGEAIAASGKLISLSTPRGRQYEAVLPDGSKVWLNAESTIEFPSTFSSQGRTVKITGEVYFEIAQNHQAPFMVKAGNTHVQVLGTSFNINSYDDEKAVRTTLVQGSVRVSPGSGNGRNIVLKPGQQAVSANNGEITGVYSPDLTSTLAWKNGFFSFDNADIETVMRQLERWYDIKVKYSGAIPTVKLNGELDRQIPLSDVLRYLSRLNIKFEREDRTITILP